MIDLIMIESFLNEFFFCVGGTILTVMLLVGWEIFKHEVLDNE